MMGWPFFNGELKMKELMFQNQPIRLVEKDGKKWASAADICKSVRLLKG